VTKRVLIAGVGRPNLGDDAAGVEIAERLRERLGDLARVVTDTGSGWELLHEGGDFELLVLIDAARSTRCLPAGEWRRIEYPRQESAIEACALRETHTMSLESMLRMARMLDRLPHEVWIYAVAGSRFEPETGLSPEVGSALDNVTETIERDVREWAGRSG